MNVTREMEDVVKFLNAKFEYATDDNEHNFKEYWTAIPIESVMKGDCEDYSLTLIKLLGNGSTKGFIKSLLFDKDISLHYVQIPQQDGSKAGHCVLEVNGAFVDNNFKRWVTKTEMIQSGYIFRYSYNVPKIAIKYLITFVVKLFNKLTGK